MKNPKLDSIDADVAHELTAIENERLRQNREEQEKGTGPKKHLPEQNTGGRNEKDEEDEMDDLYREEENRRTVEAL